MKRSILLLFIALLPILAIDTQAKPSSADLAGRWDAVIEFGKIKFRINLKITPTDEGKRIKVTMDNPDQGVNDMPVSAFLYNHPDVRLEIDQFNTAFNGKLGADGSTITGTFEEGPGGRPIDVVFKRNTEPEKPEPVKSYTLAAGETPDIRGYWKTSLEPQPGMVLRLGLKIGRLPDGSFHVLMDSFDQGAQNIPATSVTYTNGAAKVEWGQFSAVFESKLSANGKELVGTWKQGPATTPVTFARLDKPATALPDGISFVPDKISPEDIRGQWNGILDAGGNKLRLILKVGKLPDGSYSGTMASPDQGGREMAVSTAGYTNPVVRLEWKAIRGVFTGTLNKAGTEMDGTWEQWGRPSPLKLQRASAGDTTVKP